MNNPVSFELAKLLKEKGFNEPTIDQYYLSNGIYKLKEIKEGVFSNSELEKDGENYGGSNPNFWISAPILVDVLMWLYEKHNIWIVCFPTDGGWTFDIFNKIECVKSESFINSPTECYEKAIEYTLTKLI